MDYFSLTHKGKVRSQNQDRVYISPEPNLYAIVADGMGGQQAGQVASAMAVSLIRDKLKAADILALQGQDVKKMLEDTSTEIFDAAQKNERMKDMGTTLTVCIVKGGSLLVAHVGDSRAYLLREGHLCQITKDHSYVQLLVDRGLITGDEARLHPYRNMITRALGMQRVVADLFEETFLPEERLLLCSDGLTSCVSDDEIESNMNRPVSARQIARDLLALALERGGKDNISVIVVKNEGGDHHDGR